jgi:ABC-type microcin C transport system permease subunit YejB
MTAYIVQRLLLMIPTLIAISIISFLIMQAPPGDFLTSYIAQLTASGETVDQSIVEALRLRYGLDQPWYVQYWRWISGVLVGDFGISFEWQQPVSNLIWADRHGSIGYKTVGKVPIRDGGCPDLPKPGWTGEHEWDGDIPREELPADEAGRSRLRRFLQGS